MGRKGSKATKPRIIDHISSDDEDEEIDEDEAFNSEDERKYGSFFRNGGESDDGSSGSDGSEDDENDDDDDDDDGGQYMMELLEKLDQGENDNVTQQDGRKSKLANHVKESQFSTAVVPAAGLTMDSLMEGIQDTAGFGNLQKAMKKMTKQQATAVPAAKIVSDRAQRKVHYQDESKKVSEWLQAVQENRQAETLDFRPKQRLDVTRDTLVAKFTPTTDFEKKLHAALEVAGQQDEQAILKAEEKALQDDLGTNQISLEEYKKRRGQLAKMRALMFYHEQKRHHINKIKSKKYRRIRKKQRERVKEAQMNAELEENPDLERELEEKEEMERMKERMTLAHKNTSKWAKRILKRGKNVDVDTRRALSAQLKRGDDLRKRMTTNGSDDEASDSDEDLVEAAKKVLADADNEDTDTVVKEGLFKLSFMQRGLERQRQKAREEARQLLTDLEANEQEEQGSDDDEREEKAKKRKNPTKFASQSEMKELLKEGELVASSLRFNKSTATTMSEGISVETDKRDTKTGSTTTTSEFESTLEHEELKQEPRKDLPSVSTEKKSSKRERRSKNELESADSTVTDNPWLSGLEAEDGTPKAKKSMKQKLKANVDVDSAVDLLSPSTLPPKESTSRMSSSKSVNNKAVVTLTQEELVRKAFAGTSAEEAQEEFDREKEELAQREDPNRSKKKREPEQKEGRGWGSWAGMGAPPPPKKKQRLPPKLQPPTSKLPKRKRQDEAKPNVIISERRLKRLADQFMVAQLPYPFTSREEYERAMIGGIGKEWNVTSSVKDLTRPEIQTRAGKVIQPLSKKVKQPRAPAKF